MFFIDYILSSDYHWYLENNELKIRHVFKSSLEYIIPFNNEIEKNFLIGLSKIDCKKKLHQYREDNLEFETLFNDLENLEVISKYDHQKFQEVNTPFKLKENRFITYSMLLVPENLLKTKKEFTFVLRGSRTRYIKFGENNSCYICYKKRILSLGHNVEIFEKETDFLRIGKIELPVTFLSDFTEFSTEIKKIYCLPSCENFEK